MEKLLGEKTKNKIEIVKDIIANIKSQKWTEGGENVTGKIDGFKICIESPAEPTGDFKITYDDELENAINKIFEKSMPSQHIVRMGI
jgi:hypothetical protein